MFFYMSIFFKCFSIVCVFSLMFLDRSRAVKLLLNIFPSRFYVFGEIKNTLRTCFLGRGLRNLYNKK
jgi:hypothetical protein